MVAVISALLITTFAAAECLSAEQMEIGKNYMLMVPTNQESGQVNIQMYLVKNGASNCIMIAEIENTPTQFYVSVSPLETKHTGKNYFTPFITVTATKKTNNSVSESIKVKITDKDTGKQMALIPVYIGVGDISTPVPNVRNCSIQDISGCTDAEILALQMSPNIIDENLSDVYLLLGIVAAFALIVLVFFFLIPRK